MCLECNQLSCQGSRQPVVRRSPPLSARSRQRVSDTDSIWTPEHQHHAYSGPRATVREALKPCYLGNEVCAFYDGEARDAYGSLSSSWLHRWIGSFPAFATKLHIC